MTSEKDREMLLKELERVNKMKDEELRLEALKILYVTHEIASNK